MRELHVRYFLALLTERSFGQAARRCAVTKLSFTRGIRALERELGGPLFEHQSRRVRLTALGARLGPHFTAIGDCMDTIERARGRILASDRKLMNAVSGRNSTRRR